MLDEIVSEFLVESYESLDQLDRDLMALEESPEDRDRMASIFRTIHTIKGTSGFLAFPKLEKLAHVGESLLVPLRDGDLTLTNDIANNLLAMVDAVRSMLGNIESGTGEGEDSYQPLIEALEQLKSGNADAPAADAQAAESPEADAPEAETPDAASSDNPAEANVNQPPETESQEDPTDVVPTEAPSPQSGDEKGEVSPPSTASDPVADSTPNVVKSQKAASTESTAKNNTATSPAPSAGSSIADSTVRIDVHLLDKLMNLVGELVLARNQIMQFSEKTDDAGLAEAAQRVNLITTELQEGVMKTRMQPIRNAWSKLPRVVRDLSQSCGKQVQVQMEGADTELDKTILEAIKDPLTHIVRNSIDHGIELATERVTAGKPAEGTLLLRAFHEGGQVIIEIMDDGAGIGVDRVRAKAVERELITEEQAAGMSDREAVQLILLPGFSTAEKVTNVSGRGVGMDVVKTNVEKIGGTLDIQSTPGKGTTLRIKIPLTLAIVPALVVTCESDRYCIPQVNLLELVRMEKEHACKEIEILHSVPVYRLRGQLLPLVYLDEELGLRDRRKHDEFCEADAVNIVVLQAEDHQFGLVVDQINDTQEIVVKPLGIHLKGVGVYAGSTIMGDGNVSLILDVLGIAQMSHVLSEHAGRPSIESRVSNAEDSSVRDSYVIVDPGDNSRAAIHLSSVSRLEEISTSDVEHCGTQQVVQYRGEIMSLVSLSEYGQIESENGTVSLVVYNSGERNVGVVVGKVIDIVSHTGATDEDSDSQIIDGRVTRMVDLAQVTVGI